MGGGRRIVASLQEVKNLIKENKGMFYTYLLRKPDGIPFYVGKGGRKEFRIGVHIKEALEGCSYKKNRHKTNTILKILSRGNQINYEIVNFFEDEIDAYKNEIELIKLYGRKDTGSGTLTNMTDGGDGLMNPTKETRYKVGSANRGKTHFTSEETRKKLSIAFKGRKLSEDHKRKIGEKSKGRTWSEETRKKMIKALIGRIVSDETRSKISKSNRGRHLSEGHKKKIGETSKGRSWSEEMKNHFANLWADTKYRKRMSEAHMGYVHSEEHKRKIGEAGKGRIVSEETRRKIGEANKISLKGNTIWVGKKHSEETKLRMREVKLGKKMSEETKKKMSLSACISREKRRINHASDPRIV